MNRQLTVAQLDADATAWIEQQAQLTGKPVESVARDLIYRGLEVERRQGASPLHHDLDELAGTWTKEDADEFGKAAAEFSQIDPELWK